MQFLATACAPTLQRLSFLVREEPTVLEVATDVLPSFARLSSFAVTNLTGCEAPEVLLRLVSALPPSVIDLSLRWRIPLDEWQQALTLVVPIVTCIAGPACDAPLPDTAIELLSRCTRLQKLMVTPRDATYTAQLER